MAQTALVTDTTVNMPDELVSRYRITVVPLYVMFGNTSYKDYTELPPAEFYRKLAEVRAAGGKMPTTSQCTPADFVEVYRRLAKEGATDIISIHVAANSSGTVNSATIAADMVSHEVKVYPVDSGSTSMHMGYMLIEAARALEAGGDTQAALDAIEKVKANSCIYFTVTELEHLEASGRTIGADKVTEAQIKVRPVITVTNGKPVVVSAERTQRAAMDKVVELTCARMKGLNVKGVTVIHGNAPDRADIFKARVPAELAYKGEIVVTDFGPALSVHFGPGMLGLTAYGE